MKRERWIITVIERPAAVERVLGTLRRRAVAMEDLTVSRASATTLVVVVVVRVGPGRAGQVCSELEGSPDVVGLERIPEDASPRDRDDNHQPDGEGVHSMIEDTLFEIRDADPERVKGRRVAVIGYGSQGHAHALNLRESGVHVVIGLHEGSVSAERARQAGFRVVAVGTAASESDLIVLLIPDPVAPDVYREHIAPHLTPGKALLLAHGFNIHYGEIRPPEGVDVILVAPKSPGNMVRREYKAGRGVPALLAVHQDATGDARALALSYAHALGCTRAGVLETTFGAETETDLFGEQAVLCGGFTALVKAGFETLVEAGYDPRLAYFECLHELKLIVDLAYAKGLSGMRAEVSDTAEYGDYVSGGRVIGEASRAAMREILADVQSGLFARNWVEEWRSGGNTFRRMREEEGRHGLEEVGVGLRSRMAWLNEEGAA
ncbi:MAG: ketol-acid reductoisomerase [Longimicrobiales bacterium]|nr:ketol-acid reductoisomerase [Longimicrobiales bacterium]